MIFLEKINIKKIKSYNFNDLDKIVIESGTWAIVKNEKEIVIGLVGIIGNCFLQIIIKKEYRGQGYLKDIINNVLKQWNPKQLFSTISKNNLISIKAHKKLGYTQVFNGKIPKGMIRLKIK